MSDPVAMKAMPAATAAPEPLEEPDGICFVFQGLRAGGQGRSKEGPPDANSCVLVFPKRIAPALASRLQAVQSSKGTRFLKSLE